MSEAGRDWHQDAGPPLHKTASSSSLMPQEATGRACSQSPLWGAIIASSLALLWLTKSLTCMQQWLVNTKHAVFRIMYHLVVEDCEWRSTLLWQNPQLDLMRVKWVTEFWTGDRMCLQQWLRRQTTQAKQYSEYTVHRFFLEGWHGSHWISVKFKLAMRQRPLRRNLSNWFRNKRPVQGKQQCTCTIFRFTETGSKQNESKRGVIKV